MATFIKKPPAYQGGDDNVLKAIDSGLNNLAHALTLGDTWVLGPTVVNSIRVAYNRTTVDRYNTPYFDPSDLGIKLHPYIEGQMPIQVLPSFELPAGTTKAFFKNNYYQAADDLTLDSRPSSARRRRQRRVLQRLLPVLVTSRRDLDLRRQRQRNGPRRSVARPRHLRRARRCTKPASARLVSGVLRAGHLARNGARNVQPGPAMGAVSRYERGKRRGVHLQPRQLPPRRQEQGVRERPRGHALSRRRWISVRTDRAEQAVDELLAQGWGGVGPDG